jgi:hypothetical protein
VVPCAYILSSTYPDVPAQKKQPDEYRRITAIWQMGASDSRLCFAEVPKTLPFRKLGSRKNAGRAKVSYDVSLFAALRSVRALEEDFKYFKTAILQQNLRCHHIYCTAKSRLRAWPEVLPLGMRYPHTSTHIAGGEIRDYDGTLFVKANAPSKSHLQKSRDGGGNRNTTVANLWTADRTGVGHSLVPVVRNLGKFHTLSCRRA